MEQIISVKALKNLISESSNEFKAKIGPNVESEDKKNNGKAYSDAKKRAKDYDGGLSKEVGEEKAKFEKKDGNKTLLDYTPENASDDYKKRVHAQMKGYTSVAEMENGIEKCGDFFDNDNIYKGIKKSGEEMHKNEEDFKASGLQANKMPRKTFVKGEMYESKEGVDMRNMINTLKEASYIPKPILKENAKLKTVYFKKTTFLNEEHMTSRIPDEFKNEGEQFKMKDKNGTEYIVEWNHGKAEILSYENKQKINETMEKFHHITNYKSNMTRTSTTNKNLQENVGVNRMLEIMREINKK